VKTESTLAVTGASGRIGAAIVAAWTLGPTIGIDRVAGEHTSVLADIRDLDAMTRALRGCDTVIHAAALHAPHVGVASDMDFRSINVDGTEIVLTAAHRAGVGCFILTSSTAVYGGGGAAGAPARWFDEASEPEPRTIYHQTKLAAETLTRAAAGFALRTAIIRVGRCFPEPLPLLALYRLSRGIDPRDAATAHLSAIRAAATTTPVFIAAPKTPFRRSDCAELGRDAAAVIDRRCPWFAAASRARGWSIPQTIDRVYDSTQTRRALGWAPRFGGRAVLQGDDALAAFSL
jgi:UDP-glucose 4-epimerase